MVNDWLDNLFFWTGALIWGLVIVGVIAALVRIVFEGDFDK